ncbi:MAG: pyridoxal phosphate-dependent aminotransferase, partial [Bacteroidales bacterium]
KYILFISSSKAFSYAGQRIGMMVISDKLFNTDFPNFANYYKSTGFGYTMIYGTIYPLSSGTSHSPQYGLAAILKAVNNGSYNFVEEIKVYGRKAKAMKKMFIDNGFQLVYDKDEDQDLSDGFYFTIIYPGFTGDLLLEELLCYGISAISLGITGSEREGLRACVSLVNENQFPDLQKRLEMFSANHKK